MLIFIHDYLYTRFITDVDPKAYVLQHSQSVISEEEIQAQEVL